MHVCGYAAPIVWRAGTRRFLKSPFEPSFMRSPPPTKRERTSYERHGDLIHDPYLGLEEDTGAVDAWVR